MKCNCKRCDGEGTIECPECSGSGEWEVDIQEARLTDSMPVYAQLVELKGDAQRVIRQAAELSKMNPARAKSYESQLAATLKAINREASEVSKAAAKP